MPDREALKFGKMDSGGYPMRCHRCKGIMSYEKFYGAHENFWGWRCLCCGDIIDPIILENRGLIGTGSLRG
jgi:hypothetical protein